MYLAKIVPVQAVEACWFQQNRSTWCLTFVRTHESYILGDGFVRNMLKALVAPPFLQNILLPPNCLELQVINFANLLLPRKRL